MTQATKHARRGRRTVARHGELRSPGPVGFLLKVVGIVAAVVLVSGAGVAAYAATDVVGSFQAKAVDLEDQGAVPPDIGAIEGGVDLLLVGTDECEPEYAYIFGDRCTGPDASGQLNDVNMLVHISDNPRRVTVVSFPRDLMVPIPSCTREDGSTTEATRKTQINEAWGLGGLSCVAKTIKELSGENIPFAAKVSFGNVINITGAIGGVDVCIGNGGIKDKYTAIDWPAGPRTISGVEALQFLRTRHGLTGGSDLSRISNQQQYMSSLARKLVSDEVLSNPATLYKLATTASENITPSKSLANPMTLMQIALAVKNVPFEDIVFVQYPVLEDPADSDRVVPDYDSADALWAALAANVQLDVTQQSQGVIVEPQATDPAVDPNATPDPNATAEAPTVLPDNITGQNATQQTCSAGNVGANG